MNELERLRAIVAVARDMREAQREYFRSRRADWLERSKKLETSLDRMVREHDAKSAAEAQGRLL